MSGISPPYQAGKPTRKMLAAQNLQKWVMFPESLQSVATGSTQGGKFTGYQTRYDETQNEGAFVAGQNIKMTAAQTPTLRDGTAIVGADLQDSYPVNRAWVFETRNGDQFEIKAYNTGLYYWLWGQSTDWSLLKSGFTAALEFGYGNVGKSSNPTTTCFFSNGTDGVFAFNGAFGTVAAVSNAAGSITVLIPHSGNAGTGYVVGDIVTITGGSGTATAKVLTLTGSAVATLGIVFPGTGYSATNSVVTTGGTGTGLQVDISTVQTGYIQFTGTTSATDLGFFSTGALKVINGTTEYTYVTAAAYGPILIGISPSPATIVVGSLIVQTPQVQDGTSSTSNLTSIQGHIMMAHDGRLHMNNDAKADVWQYSKLNDPFNFTTGSNDGDGGAEEVEFGGAILAFGKLNKSAEAIKTRIIKNLDFIQVGSKVDSPQYTTLVSADDKGTSLGCTNQKSTFSTPFGLVFTTPDNRMVLLTGVTANNQPQYFFLSDPVAEVFQQGVHDEATGICVDNRVYYSFKQTSASTFNDVEIQGNMLRQSFDAQGRAIPIFWDTPNVGINCNDYTAIYNPTIQKYEVHRHSSLNSNTYAQIDTKTDDNEPFTAIVRTWGETFGSPDSQKYIDYVMVEIKMLANTVVQTAVLFDQNGSSGIQNYTLRGSDTENLVQASAYNPFGASPYGQEKIGSNSQQTALQRYIYWLELGLNQEFFSISLQFTSDTENSDFELIRFGYRLVTFIEVDLKFKKNTN